MDILLINWKMMKNIQNFIFYFHQQTNQHGILGWNFDLQYLFKKEKKKKKKSLNQNKKVIKKKKSIIYEFH